MALISACAAGRSIPTPSPLPSPTTSPTSAPTFTPSPTAAVIDVQPADALAFFDARRGLMVGTDAADGAGRGLVWRTGDGGRTWTRPVAVAPGPLQSITVVGTSLAWARASVGPPP
ncbi:MAG: exo-alpha-sialidase [Chloroflexota bacterium]|nr:MAG: exo-alpha-sialidase [Chloroflexota bacterium]